jgi:trehalose-phosphatase
MVGLDDLLYVGNHGLERWDKVNGYRNDAASFESDVHDLRPRLEEALAGAADVRIEDKGTILSLHYRGASRPEETRRRIIALLDRLLAPGGLLVAEGKMVIEVRPPLPLDKGTVVEGLARERGLRGVVYLGDDITDIDAIRALKSLRVSGFITLGIAVGGQETPQALVAEADALLPDPQAAAEFLGSLDSLLSA